jgi:hypothetical protein
MVRVSVGASWSAKPGTKLGGDLTFRHKLWVLAKVMPAPLGKKAQRAGFFDN